MIEMYYTHKGYEIRRDDTNQRWPLYLSGVYGGEFQWTRDYLYAKHYKSRKVAFKNLKEIKRKYQDDNMECVCICCNNTDVIKMKETEGIWWGECPQCGAEFWIAR